MNVRKRGTYHVSFMNAWKIRSYCKVSKAEQRVYAHRDVHRVVRWIIHADDKQCIRESIRKRGTYEDDVMTMKNFRELQIKKATEL